VTAPAKYCTLYHRDDAFAALAEALESGTQVRVGRDGHKERVGRLLLMHANQREEITHAHTGMIVAAIGLKDVRTGDTLTSLDVDAVLESMTFPEPVVELAIFPKTAADRDRLGGALRKLALEDPSFRVSTDEESGEIRIRGMGELHLEVIVDRLRSEHGVEARMGKPSVSYRETLTRAAQATYRHVKQDGGPGQFAVVTLAVAPRERGAGFHFVDATRGGSVPKEFIPAVRKGVEGALERGLVAGYPFVDVEVTLLDGAFHEKDSSGLAFETAASRAFQEAAKLAGAQLLEPVMAVEVVTPEESLGTVIGDLNSRRGQVLSLNERGTSKVVDAHAPLSTLFGYVPGLRGLSRGRANATMHFAHYAAVPPAIAQQMAK
jgi:elongation factor G